MSEKSVNATSSLRRRLFVIAMACAPHLPIIFLYILQGALEGYSLTATVLLLKNYHRFVFGQLDILAILGVLVASTCLSVDKKTRLISTVAVEMCGYFLIGGYVVGARSYGGLGGL